MPSFITRPVMLWPSVVWTVFRTTTGVAGGPCRRSTAKISFSMGEKIAAVRGAGQILTTKAQRQKSRAANSRCDFFSQPGLRQAQLAPDHVDGKRQRLCRLFGGHTAEIPHFDQADFQWICFLQPLECVADQ